MSSAYTAVASAYRRLERARKNLLEALEKTFPIGTMVCWRHRTTSKHLQQGRVLGHSYWRDNEVKVLNTTTNEVHWVKGARLYIGPRDSLV